MKAQFVVQLELCVAPLHEAIVSEAGVWNIECNSKNAFFIMKAFILDSVVIYLILDFFQCGQENRR